jgi:multiple sugar transport system ATP-binding protein
VAVDALDLDVADGELMVLVGPSGCGKSTALRMVAGLETPTAGTITIGDRDVAGLSPAARDVAMVFQSYALYPHMTVRKNLAFPLQRQRRPRAEIAGRVADVSAMLELTELLERKPAQLSGGQRQRVAMGRAMVRAPQAFLMDEPLSNLDAKLRVQMRAELARLRDQLGTTTVYVTHDQVEAMTLGDRVAVMCDGVVQQLDTPQNLYAHPANLFVAAFMGSPSMNLFEATVDGESVAFGGHRLPLAAGRLRGHLGPVVVGIRPSDFEDADVWRDETRAVLEVPVSVVEELGADSNVIFALDARPAVDITGGRSAEEDGEAAEAPLIGTAGTTVCTACVDARTRALPGETVRLSVDPARLHFFDAVSGEVLAPPEPVAAAAGRGSALHAGERDPLDEHPLGEEEEHDHRQHEDQGGRHRQVPVDVVQAAERRERHREGL